MSAASRLRVLTVAIFGSLRRLGYGGELLAGSLYGLAEQCPVRIPAWRGAMA